MIKQSGDERPAVISGRRMNNHPPRLVYNDYVAVLIYYVKRDVLRLRLAGFHRRIFNLNRIPAPHFVVFFFFSAANGHTPVRDELLRIGACDLVRFGQENVEPHTLRIRSDVKSRHFLSPPTVVSFSYRQQKTSYL